MSRSGYCDDWGGGQDEGWRMIRWRGAVESAIRGRRGQALLRELLTALDAMPEKRLTANALERPDGEVCALGAVGKARGIDMSKLDPEESDGVASAFGIAGALAREIAYQNDEGGWGSETPERRWVRMRRWVVRNIRNGEMEASE